MEKLNKNYNYRNMIIVEMNSVFYTEIDFTKILMKIIRSRIFLCLYLEVILILKDLFKIHCFIKFEYIKNKRRKEI